MVIPLPAWKSACVVSVRHAAVVAGESAKSTVVVALLLMMMLLCDAGS